MQGFALAVALPLLLTLALAAVQRQLNLVSDVLLFLLTVVVVALVGGFLPAMIAALGGSLLLNYYFVPPLHTFTIADPNNALALGVFVVVAALVSSVVDLAARRTRQAARATAEAETLATLAGSVLRGETALPALLERVREAFGLTSVTLLEQAEARPPTGGRGPQPVDEWVVVAAAGEGRAQGPQDADTQVPAGESLHACPARPPAACRGPAGGRRLRRPGRGAILERHRLRRGGRGRGPAGRGRQDPDRAAGGGRTRPAHARWRPRRRPSRSLRSDDVRWTPSDRRELLSPRTSRWTGWPGWSTTCWT